MSILKKKMSPFIYVAFLLSLLCHSSLADINTVASNPTVPIGPPSNTNNISSSNNNNNNDNIASSTEVTIAPSSMQLNQIKALFSNSDYQNLEHTTANAQKSLVIDKGKPHDSD